MRQSSSGLFIKAASCPLGHDAIFVFVPSRLRKAVQPIKIYLNMDKNKLPYVSPEVETVGIIPENSVLSSSIEKQYIDDPWF